MSESVDDLDLAGIRARAEKGRERWWVAFAPYKIIAMCDLIERQAEEIARLKVERDTLETRGLQLAEALKPFANSAAQWTHARSYDDRLQGLRCSVGCVEFDRALIAMARQSVSAALTSKEDTPCRTA